MAEETTPQDGRVSAEAHERIKRERDEQAKRLADLERQNQEAAQALQDLQRKDQLVEHFRGKVDDPAAMAGLAIADVTVKGAPADDFLAAADSYFERFKAVSGAAPSGESPPPAPPAPTPMANPNPAAAADVVVGTPPTVGTSPEWQAEVAAGTGLNELSDRIAAGEFAFPPEVVQAQETLGRLPRR